MVFYSASEHWDYCRARYFGHNRVDSPTDNVDNRRSLFAVETLRLGIECLVVEELAGATICNCSAPGGARTLARKTCGAETFAGTW